MLKSLVSKYWPMILLLVLIVTVLWTSRYAGSGKIEAQISKNDASKGAKSTDNSEHSLSWIETFTWPEGVTAWSLLLTLMVIAWQSTETRAAARATQTSAEAAKVSAEAAKTSADIAVGVSIPTLVVHELGVGDVGAANVGAFFQCPKMKITIKNYGQTPAFLKWWTLCFSCEDLPEVPIYGPGNRMVLNKVVVQPDAICTLPELPFFQRREFSIEEVKAIVKRERPFYVYGYICYGDIFGNPLRRIKFCETVLNIFGDAAICDWWEGLAPPAYTGTEQYPNTKAAQQKSEIQIRTRLKKRI